MLPDGQLVETTTAVVNKPGGDGVVPLTASPGRVGRKLRTAVDELV